MHEDLVWVAAGLSLLLAVVLPELLQRWAVSAPMVLVTVGIAMGFTSLPDGLPLDPQANRAAIEHITELVVIVALMGVGLAIDRPLQFLSRASWARWSTTWRLLVVAMPLSIAGVAALGLALGLPAAVALLLGAALAPTDPVLASDVQVAGPQTEGQEGEEQEVDESDELRFALTSEAGLNDSLAFPFVYGAILLAGHDSVADWLPMWIGFHLIGKVVIGVVAGIAVGKVLSYAAFRSGSRSLRVAERGESLMALAALVTAYGVGEVAGGYGFLAVFVCAMTFRSAERSHDYHAAMHDIVQRLERLLTLFVLLVLGVALSRGLLESLDWRGVVLGLALVFVVRPISGILALAPYVSHERPRLDRGQRRAAAFFGVRGIGSIFYVAYAAGEAPELGTDWLWSTVTFTIVLSVFVHGVLASPVMKRIDSQSP